LAGQQHRLNILVRMPIDARAADAQWRRLARGDGAPWLHAEVARRMGERLALVRKAPSSIVDWSGFLGGAAGVLQAQYPRARRIVVEPHAALQRRSAEAAARPWWSPRRWTGAPPDVVAAGADLAALPDRSADLLWSNMALHAAPDAPAWLAQWRRLLADDGFLMFSTFGPDTLGTLRTLYREAGWPAPAQDFVDMHDVGDALVHAGFADPVMDQEHLALTWATSAEALAELRTLGGNLHPARMTGLRTPRWRARLEAALVEHCGDAQGRVALPFEVVYGHAFVAATRLRVAERTEVPVDTLRAMARRRGPQTLR
jgi:malonyl-CoA O-methyltransferase